MRRCPRPYLNQIPKGCRLVDLEERRVLWTLSKLAGWLRRQRPSALLATMEHANLVAMRP